MSSVELKAITEENWRETLTLAVDPTQQPFVAGVTPVAAIALAKAYIRPGGKTVEPYGVYQQETMVGFFNLHYTPNSYHDFWLFHFFIDQRFQRRRLGSAAVTRLIQHIQDHHPTCSRLRLTVHPQIGPRNAFTKRSALPTMGCSRVASPRSRSRSPEPRGIRGEVTMTPFEPPSAVPAALISYESSPMCIAMLSPD